MSVKFNILGPQDDSSQLNYKGIFDIDTIYRMLREFFESRGFEYHEYNYKSKEPAVGELELYWQAWRNDSEFLRVWFNVYVHFENMEPVEVIKDGVKKRMVRGRLRMRFYPFFELDYEERFEKSKFLETIRDFYIDNIVKKKIQVYGDKEEYEFFKFIEKFKKELGMGLKGDQFHDMW